MADVILLPPIGRFTSSRSSPFSRRPFPLLSRLSFSPLLLFSLEPLFALLDRLLPLLESPVLPVALLHLVGALPLLLLGEGGRAARVPVGDLIEAGGEETAGDLAVLGAGAGSLGLNNDARRDVLELDGGVGFVLLGSACCSGLYTGLVWAVSVAGNSGGWREAARRWEGGRDVRSSDHPARCPLRTSPRCLPRAVASGAAGGWSP